MATFNQVLQSQIQPEQTVKGPSMAGFLAGAAETVSSGIQNFAQALTESDAERKKKEVFGKAEQIIRMEEDLIASGVGQAKARQRINDVLRSSFPDDPEMQLTLRSQLAGYRGGFLSQQVKQDVISSAEMEGKQADELLSLIPKDQLPLYINKPPSTMTPEEKISSFERYQGAKLSADSALKEQNRILQQQTVNSINDINSWHKSMMDARNQPLSLATSNFFTSINGIDLQSAEGTVQFQQAKLQARQAASLVEQNIRAEYDMLIQKINDPKLIDLAEKKRDSLLSTVENFITDIESDSLDILKIRGQVFDALVQGERLPYWEAIGQGQILQQMYGSAAMGVAVQEVMNKNAEYRKALTNNITGMLDINRLRDIEIQSDDLGYYQTPELWQVGYGGVREAALSRRGVQDPVFSERLAKNYIKGANLAGRGGLAMQDVKVQLDDYKKLESHWSQLSEQERQAVDLARDRLEQAYVLDPTDGLVGILLGNGQAKWNSQTMKLEYIGGRKISEVRGDVPLPGATQERINTRLAQEGKAQIDDANKRLSSVIQKLKLENPSLSDEEILKQIPVIQKFM